MRQRLTLAIEIISLISAVGVVISATTYSLIFHQYGLNYLAIASISDIIRDSIKILILFASVAILIFPLSGLIARSSCRLVGKTNRTGPLLIGSASFRAF